MYKKTKNQLVYILVSIIAVMLGLIIIIQVNIKHELANDIIIKEKKQLTNIYNHALDEFYLYYESMGKELLQNKLLLNAIKNKNREETLKIVQPFYKELKSKNKYFYNMHFHTVDNKSFLRVHKPGKFGDDLSSFRKIVVATNKTKKIQKGLEPGKHAVSFRVVLPIIYNNEHIGSVEFGVDINYFLELFDKRYGVKSFYIIHNKFLEYLLKYSQKKVKVISDFSIFDEINNFNINYSMDELDSILHKGTFKKLDDNIYLSEISKIYTFGDKPIGHICFDIDMKYFLNKVDTFQIYILFSFLLFFILIFILLNQSFSHFENVASRHLKKIKDMSYLDELTKIYNRKKLIELIDCEYRRKQRYKINNSIILLDIDNFKNINDTYGHNTGDIVLKELVSIVNKSIRQTDHFARWGGEEFIILAPETGIDDTETLANKLKDAISNNEFTTIKHVTCSFGIATLDINENYTMSIHNADVALYYSKQNGKNQVTKYTKELESI